MNFKGMDFKGKGLPLIITAVAALAIVAVCAYVIIHNTPPPPAAEQPAPVADMPAPTLSITAEKEGPAGIERDSGFIISSAEPIRAGELEARLSLEPQISFTLTQRAEGELYLKPAEELKPGSIYNVLLSENSYEPPQSWAFQTKNNFRLLKTFPARGGSWVPVNSGVELTFSQPVEGIGAFVSISPALAGRFEAFNDTTVVFIPGEAMQYNTDYTVTLAADLPSTAGDTLGEAASFTFHTESARDSNRYYFYPYDGFSETFTTADPIYVKLYAGSDFAEQEIQADIYRYSGLDAYLAAEKSHLQDEGGVLPTAGLTKVAGFSDTLLMSNEMYWNLAYLPLPENPGPGWYLVDMQVTSAGGMQGQRAQKLLQITDISVYAQTANNQLLLWLNDAASGQALAGAQITLAGQTATSDENGVALFTVPAPEPVDAEYRYYWDFHTWKKEVKIRQGDMQYGAYLSLYAEYEYNWQNTYYTYVYTDRAAYQPDDTVRFWGLVLPRVSGAARPGSIKLEWTAGGLYPDGIEIQVQADGTFMGELKLEKQVSGWENLQFTLDGKYLISAGITIMQYVKPAYSAVMTLDKDYYRKGDTIQALAEVSFFDGTPARAMNIAFSYNDYAYSGGEVSQTAETDENGRCQAEFKLQPGDSWQPRYQYINAKNLGAEEQTLYFERPALTFPSDYMVEAAFTAEEEWLSFSVTGHKIDFSAVDSGAFTSQWDTGLLRGRAAELTGQAILYQVEYVRKKTGEFYDFINKVTVDQFEYERVEKVLDSFPLQTEDGQFTLMPLPYPEAERAYYYIELSVTAPDGQRLNQTCYAPGRDYYYWDSRADLYQRYSFSQDIDAGNDNYVDRYGYINEYYDGDYYYSGESHAYRGLYEETNIRLSDQNDTEPAPGRLLYTVLGGEVYDYAVQEGSIFSLPFLPQYTPNVMVLGAYFDGKHIFTVEPTTLVYHFPDSELTIEVKPDQERYRPGEQVTLKLNITDKEGRGVAAHYLVSVADEAAFAVMEQEVKALRTIYSSRYIEYSQYASYIQPYDFGGGAESGEGGSDSVRRDFVDTVAFLSGDTDAKGQATVRFKLADNITSWRLTSIAFCEQTYGTANVPLAGKNISNIASGLPFFINPVLNGRALTGESIGLSLRGAGTAIRDTDMVDYEVILSGEGVDISITAHSPAGTFRPLTFEPLPEGSYTILIKASCGSYSDALELPLEVAESLLITSRQQSGDLSAGLNIQANRFPVRLTLYDIDNTLYYDTLYALLNSYGSRADQILVRALAGQRLNGLTDESRHADKPDIDAEEAASWRYGLRLFPYAETDPLLTAKAVAVAGQFLDGPALAAYFREVLANADSTTADRCASYMGLAALREPVLLELRKLLTEAQKSDDYTLEDRLHLATGLALLGDHGTANAWYKDNIHDALSGEGNTLSFTSENGAHYDYVLTAGAAMLASLLNHKDHRGLLAYLTSHRSATYAPLLELAAYIDKYAPKPESAAALSYTLSGQSVSFSFEKQRQLYLELGETQLAEANFAVENGNVGYTAYYFGGLRDAETALPEGVSITHKLSADTLKMGQNLTVTTTVTFSGEAPVGVYHIAQVAPTGLRFAGVPGYSYNGNWYYRAGEMGLIDFYIYPLSKQQNADAFGRDAMPASVTFSYQARAVLPGTYIMEADAVSYSGSNTLYATERRQVMVTE